MRVYYHCNGYVSYARAGTDNMQALAQAGHELVAHSRDAEVVVLHDEPVNYEALVNELKGCEVPVVGYAVVETDPMPPAYAHGLSLVDEVWTCSGFSRDLLAEASDNVHVIPHVVRRPRFSGADMERVRSLMGPGDAFTFYTVSDSYNPRKNLPALLRAFATFSRPRYRLVVKQYRKPMDLSGLPGVVSITERLTDAEMAALHASCDCYVSPHCAEAWGLSLSEAMAFGKPVVATGYSGNLEFMDATNSFLVSYEERTIRSEELRRCPPFFTPDMRWAYVNEADLAATMRLAVAAPPELIRGATGVAKRFGPAAVGLAMDRRLRVLASPGSRA